MLLVIAMADAYGAAFEFAENEFIQAHNCLTKYHQPGGHDTSVGHYTDDTQMSIAICELMINEKNNWSKQLVAEYFLKVFKRDPRRSYADEFYHFLDTTESSKDFIENIYCESVRNGAVMRSVPLGLIKNKQEMLQKVQIQASVTHNTYEAIVASQAVALSVYYFVNKLGNKIGLHDYVCQQTNELFLNTKVTPTQCNAIDTVDAVLTVLTQSSTLTEILDNAVKLGGDTDSVASIACGIAFFSDEYAKDFPNFLERDIENGRFGKDYLIKLNKKFMDKVQYFNA